MKKMIGAVMAMAAMASIGTGETENLRSSKSIERHNLPSNDAMPSLQEIAALPYVNLKTPGYLPSFSNCGLSPKDYGQWLQSRGKQKWTLPKKNKA